MAENSAIEWCDHTFNPWQGCTKVSPGCDHCYAEARQDTRLHVVKWGAGQERKRTGPHNWRTPLAWDRKHAEFFAQHGRRQRVFCASLADVFDNAVPAAWRTDLFDLIASTPNLDWLLLTKRIGNADAMMKAALVDLGNGTRDLLPSWPWSNVWLGATIVNQEEANRDIPRLLATPAAKHFLSIEPLLGPVDLRLPTRTWTTSAGGVLCDHCCNGDRCDDPTHCERGRPEWRIHCGHCRGTGRGKPIDWVIAGGESGPKSRPAHHDWVRSLRDQCKSADVPFLFKQWGEWLPEGQQERSTAFPDVVADNANGCPPGGYTEARVYRWPGGRSESYRAGKKNAGRLLDGIEHNGFPEVRHG
jgi:protein gp37